MYFIGSVFKFLYVFGKKQYSHWFCNRIIYIITYILNSWCVFKYLYQPFLQTLNSEWNYEYISFTIKFFANAYILKNIWYLSDYSFSTYKLLDK